MTNVGDYCKRAKWEQLAVWFYQYTHTHTHTHTPHTHTYTHTPHTHTHTHTHTAAHSYISLKVPTAQYLIHATSANTLNMQGL